MINPISLIFFGASFLIIVMDSAYTISLRSNESSFPVIILLVYAFSFIVAGLKLESWIREDNKS